MKGIIFNLLEDFIVTNLGDEAYEEILATPGLQTTEPFVGPGSYPDMDLMTLFARVQERMGIPIQEVLRAFGLFSLPVLARRFPIFVAHHTHAKDFLLSVDAFHATEINKLFDGAKCPRFHYESPSPDRLTIRYESERRLCAVAEGLLDGVAAHFDTPIVHFQSSCMLRGDPACVFDLRFPGTETPS